MSDSHEVHEFPAVWADSVHAARFARGISIFLTLINVFLLAVVWIVVSEPDPQPLVIRVNEIGRAQVVDYDLDRATTAPDDPVVPYFLNTFVDMHYSRRHGLGAEEWQRSHFFLDAVLSNEAYARDEDELVQFIASQGQASEQLVQNIRIRLIPSPDPPYTAQIFYERVERFYDAEIARRTYSLSLRFVFADSVPLATRLVNPLGIVIVYLDVQEEIVASPVG